MVVEMGPVSEIYHRPKHPYTWALLQSLPRLDVRRHRLASIAGSPPNMLKPPTGCPFHPRCPYAMRACAEEMPEMRQIADGHQTACWLSHPEAPHVSFPGEAAGT